MMFPRFQVQQKNLIHLVSLLLILAYNIALFRNFFNAYPLTFTNIAYALSLALVIFALIDILLTLVCFKYTTKLILIIVFMVSAPTSYFMNSYNIIIDPGMIQNVFYTNRNEAFDLLNFRLVLYVIFLGIVPSIIISYTKISYTSFNRKLFLKVKTLVLAVLIIVSQFLLFGKFYSSFIREHKSIRYYANPVIIIYSTAKFIGSKVFTYNRVIKPIAQDATIVKSNDKRKLVILVVGETVRADHFSLNGYKKKTNPLLEKENIFNFKNFTSCGTSTAASVPCMFSHLSASDYDELSAHNTENILDVLQHVGVNVLWRDNNSDSKHVAVRIPFENFKLSKNNPVCDIECRDIGMLSGLEQYIKNKQSGDILIVLHQMGNHGPAYYKRYPASFEKFKPACKTKQLENCTTEQISNSYDNAILYTDYFLSETIKFLKQYDKQFNTGMIYMSDHGESLGENGVYLHGLPVFMAPDAQTHVPALLWLGDSFKGIDRLSITKNSDKPYSHDNLFHTLLGLFNVKTSVYIKSLDLTHN